MKKLLSLLIIATIITSSLCVSYFAIDDNSTQNTTETTTVPVTETSSTVVTTESVTESSTVESSTVPTTTKPIVKPVVKVKRIKLNKSIVNLAKKGKTCTVKATVYPNNAYNKSVNWTSNNKKVAKVDKNGKIKATTNKGTTYVNAIAKDGSKIRTRVLVVVGEKVKKITLNKTSVTLNRGAKNRTFQLKKAIKNKNATYKGVSWYSSNKNVATVNSTGKVTIKHRGKVVITVKARDGSNKSAKCTITVKQLVSKIIFNKNNKYDVDWGKSITLKASVEPSDASIKTIKWKSSNTKVLTVNQKGKVTAKGLGSAVITASATDGSGVKASRRVNVNVTMNTKLTHKQFVSNKEYVDMYCKALNDYFESCGAVINPNMVGSSQWCVTETTDFSDNMKIYDFMVETVNIWTCRMAKDNINNNVPWKDLKKGKSLIDFLEEIGKIGSSNMSTYNPEKMLDADWNGWKQECEYDNPDRILNIYVYPSKINTSAGTEYIIYMYWDTNGGLKRKGIPLVKE